MGRCRSSVATLLVCGLQSRRVAYGLQKVWPVGMEMGCSSGKVHAPHVSSVSYTHLTLPTILLV